MSGSVLPPIPLYLADIRNEPATAAKALVANPVASQNLAYFQQHAASITTPQALLGNYRALAVVLGAFGIGNAINNTAVIKDLLTQNPTDPKSLAQRLGNPKYLLFAKTLSKWNPPPFSNPANIASIVSGYQLNTFEAAQGQQVPGLQQALYFTRTIGGIKSLTQIQADPDLLKVVVTASGLPYENFSLLNFDQQTRLLKSKVHLADFQNPHTVQRYAQQYLVAQQLNGAAPTGPAAGSTASLYSDSADTSGNAILDILGTANGSTALSQSDTGTNLLSLFA